MCGFAGVVAFDEQFRASRQTLDAMTARIAHRGPDGRGSLLSGSASLSHVRLAILDPDPRSNQPFQIGPLHLLFNGEIYNFPDLRAQLTQDHPDYAWRTTGDTETLLRAYAVWGPDCLPKLNGMFAFAIWNQQDNSLFLARDPAGQKPLYYAIAPNHAAIAFASELAALTPLPWPDRTLNQSALSLYLSLGYIPSPQTIHQGIHKLPHSTSLHLLPYHPPNLKHYTLPSSHNPPATIHTLFPTAVSRQLLSDVPVGCFLSGGIDSSITALCMTRANLKDQRILTFSIGFDDPLYDETPFAREVAHHLNTEHHEFRVTPDAAADLPKLAGVFGEPFADSSALPTHYLARATRDFVKVALSGDGGDELFGGYDRYRALHLSQRLHPFSPLLRAASLLPGTHPKSRAARLKRFASSLHLPPAARYASYLHLFSPAQVAALTNLPPTDYLESLYTTLSPHRDPVQTALAVDRETYLPEDLFTKVDRAAMLHALEVRSPFMDPDVLNFASTLTTDQLLTGGGKRLLREAFAADLPPSVFRRRKMGFAIPIGAWFRSSLKPLLHDALFATHSFAATHLNPATVRTLVDEHDRQTLDHSQRLYALLMLELWWRSNR